MSKPSFLQFMQEKDQLDEAFNSAPYELTMGKKNAGDVFFTFIDEDEKEYRIQFYTPQGLGKNVRQVFIGQKRGSVYPDAIARFKNPMRVIASMIEATKQFLATPLGKTIDGYAVNFSKKALDRGMTLIPKIVRQSGLKQKLNVMDLTYAPVPDRGYVWLVKKGKDPAQVFDGPKMQGITWDDPDKVGDVPVQNNTPDVGNSSSTPTTGWSNQVAPAGNPHIDYQDKKGILLGSIGLRFSPIHGLYSGSSKAVNFKEIEGTDVAEIAQKLKLPAIPNDVLNKFTAAAESWWNSKNVLPPRNTSDWNISVMAKSNGIFSSVVKVIGANDVTLSSNDLAIMVKDGAMAKIAHTQSIAQVTVFNKEYVGRGEIEQKTTSAARRGMGWELSSGGKVVAYVEFGVGAVAPVQSTVAELTTDRWRALVNAFYKVNGLRGVQSMTMASGSVTFGGKAAVVATINRSITKGSDPVLLTVKAVTELGPGGQTIGQPIIIRDIDITKPSKFTGVVQGAIDQLTPLAKASEPNPNAISSKDLRIPKNASVFGETENGMSVAFNGFEFPKGGKYEGTVFNLNFSYLYGKERIVVTPMFIQKGRRLGNPKSYEARMDKQTVQSSLDRWSDDMDMVARNMQTLKSASYNPAQVFLEDFTLDDHGGIKWRGFDMADRRTTDKILKIVGDEADRLEAEGAKPSAANDVAGKMTQERWELFLTEFESVPGLSKVNYGRDKAKALYVYGNSDYLDITMTRLSDKSEIYVDGKNSNGMLSSRWDSWNDGQYIAKTAKDVQAMLNQAIKKGETVMGGEPKQAPAAASLNGKTKETLAAYIESIRSSAPNTRDVTWQFLSRSNGQEVEIYWDLTFRRDTKTGAYGQYKSQIDLANRYVQSIVDDARKKGYSTSAPDLYTRDKAMADDRRAEEYGEGAYSEYEQAMSGGVTISILK